jgi:hypothetical protein
MSKHDRQARPIYHRTRDSIEAHLGVVFAAMAVSHWIEHRTGWSIKKFVRTARRYRTVTIQVGSHTLTAAEPHHPTSQKPSPKSMPYVRTSLIKVGPRCVGCACCRGQPSFRASRWCSAC